MPKSKSSENNRPKKATVGMQLLHNPILNKGTAFTDAEREDLKLRGLLPPRVCSQDQQMMRVLENLRRKPTDLEKYIFLVGLQNRNETLFYRTLVDNIEELMPIIYTPTVGKACQKYGHIFRRPRGLYLISEDRGRIDAVLQNWPHDDVSVVVVTDGERILGLGDLGANGMGIPVGKLALYTACAGVDPSHCLPITIDVGTNNEALLEDPLYIGLPQRRIDGSAYVELMDEFMESIRKRYPEALIQFEDFSGTHAFNLLNRYRSSYRMFNDDIQGTAAVTLAGLRSALRISGGALSDQRVLFMGAGAAGIGIGSLLACALEKGGVPKAEALRASWFFDSKGLVVAGRERVRDMQKPFAHKNPEIRDFAEAVRVLKPTAIVGVSGRPSLFTEKVVREMAKLNVRPIIFPLSNPTSQAECTAEEAYGWSEGRAIFASGSPFDPVSHSGKLFQPGQGNNAYIFPGVGLGVVASGAGKVTDEMFLVAAAALSDMVREAELGKGMLYPPLGSIREVSKVIAVTVAEEAFRAGVSSADGPDDLADYVGRMIYSPDYETLA